MQNRIEEKLRHIDRLQVIRIILGTLLSPFAIALISKLVKPFSIFPIQSLWFIGLYLMLIIGLPIHFYLVKKDRTELHHYLSAATYVMLIFSAPFALPLLLIGVLGAVYLVGTLMWTLPIGLSLALCFWFIVRPDQATRRIRQLIDDQARQMRRMRRAT